MYIKFYFCGSFCCSSCLLGRGHGHCRAFFSEVFSSSSHVCLLHLILLILQFCLVTVRLILFRRSIFFLSPVTCWSPHAGYCKTKPFSLKHFSLRLLSHVGYLVTVWLILFCRSMSFFVSLSLTCWPQSHAGYCQANPFSQEYFLPRRLSHVACCSPLKSILIPS